VGTAAPAAPAAPATPAPPAEKTPAAAPPETPDLVGSWTAYQRLAAAGIGPASLEALLAGAEHASAQPSRDTARPPAPAPALPELPVVDIRTLLYRGDQALRRAQELRAEARTASGERLRALIDEVCDLVALALEPAP
ncbi:MAG: hypothetical protein ACREL9_05105, partial [Gemmatimonadales bacterium]